MGGGGGARDRGRSEVATLLHAAEGSPLYLPVLVAVTTGMRRGELLGLRWSDIDLKVARLTVNQSLERSKGKSIFKSPKTHGSRRSITLPALTVEALKEYRAQQGRIGAGELMLSHAGIPRDPDSLTKAFDRSEQRALGGSHSTVCATPTSRIS